MPDYEKLKEEFFAEKSRKVVIATRELEILRWDIFARLTKLQKFEDYFINSPLAALNHFNISIFRK